ncbi:hypothetical protein PENSUB_13408 [Penicillium subrubescens]|jgi:hypothetical protein|uniref:Uncharacterized protein n=1 Tax=Penicillium subrubescens TaxID=1316194 RepID=A0A1Q5SQW9_9EURO|nr:hypothetical protein PENSUB_13408 [Penicillium subrubescens]
MSEISIFNCLEERLKRNKVKPGLLGVVGNRNQAPRIVAQVRSGPAVALSLISLTAGDDTLGIALSRTDYLQLWFV